MATGHDIVNSTSDLVDALNKLVETDTFEAVIEVARAVGAQPQINTGVDALVALLDEINQGLEQLRDPLTHLGALSGLVALIRPLMTSLSQAGQQVADELESLGASGVGDVVGPVLDTGPKALDSADGFLSLAPDLESVTRLQGEIDAFRLTLQAYKDGNGNGG